MEYSCHEDNCLRPTKHRRFNRPPRCWSCCRVSSGWIQDGGCNGIYVQQTWKLKCRHWCMHLSLQFAPGAASSGDTMAWSVVWKWSTVVNHQRSTSLSHSRSQGESFQSEFTLLNQWLFACLRLLHTHCQSSQLCLCQHWQSRFHYCHLSSFPPSLVDLFLALGWSSQRLDSSPTTDKFYIMTSLDLYCSLPFCIYQQDDEEITVMASQMASYCSLSHGKHWSKSRQNLDDVLMLLVLDNSCIHALLGNMFSNLNAPTGYSAMEPSTNVCHVCIKDFNNAFSPVPQHGLTSWVTSYLTNILTGVERLSFFHVSCFIWQRSTLQVKTTEFVILC